MKRLARHILLTCALLGMWTAQAAGPRDNPLFSPPMPDLPDLYGEETKQEESRGSEDIDRLPPPLRQPADLGRLAGGQSRASAAMRAELQRQIASYHALTGQPETALSLLLAAHNRGWLTFDDHRTALDAARLYHRLDLPAEAERLYSGVPEWLVPQDERQHFLIDRVQSHYDRGDYRSASRALERLGTPADLAIANRAESLRIRILMAQGRFSEINRIFEEHLGRPRNNLYTHYNLGVSMVAGGQTGEGIGQLDELGSIPAIDPEPVALRDQANLSLGWAFLEAGQGATARPFLRRIRLNSPASGRALLGLGWALLAPDGEPQEKTIARLKNCLDDPAQVLQNSSAVLRRPARESCSRDKPRIFRYQRPLEYEAGEEDARKRLQAALAAWDQLRERPAHDPSVQEALLARGYALEQMQRPREAAEAYRYAIRRLEEEHIRMQAVRHRLELAPLAVLDQPPASQPYLVELLSSPQFEETRHGLHALESYGRRLQALQARLDKIPADAGERRAEAVRRLTQLQRRHTSLHDSFADVVLRLTRRHFEQRGEQLNTYLRRARLSLAQLHGRQS